VVIEFQEEASVGEQANVPMLARFNNAGEVLQVPAEMCAGVVGMRVCIRPEPLFEEYG
jgi:hypothetical protein